MRSRFPAARRAAVAAAVLLAGIVGCDSNLRTYPVRGKVMLEDGRLVTRGVVLFEGASGGALVSARGTITPNGTYEMSTYKPGDGVPAGKYRVQINPIDLSDTPDEQKNLPFDVKYTRFDTSGLTYEVKAGPNAFDIKLGEGHPPEGKPDEAKPKDEPKAGEPKPNVESKPKDSE